MGSHLDLAIVGVYVVVLAMVGLTFRRLVEDSSDYFRAGAKGSWWLMGASMFTSGISAYTFVGNAAGIYHTGWSLLAIYVANVAGFLAGAFFLGSWYRQMRATTYAEVIERRFGKTAERLLTHLLVVNSYTWSGVGLYTLAVFIAPLMPGVPVEGLILGIGMVALLYSTIGGSWATIANDFLQGLVMIAVTTTIVVLCFIRSGGIWQFFERVGASPSAADLGFVHAPPVGASDWTSNYGISWIVISFIIQFANQTCLFQGVRYFPAKDGPDARKASLMAAVLMSLGFLLFFIPPIYARVNLAPQVLAMNPSPQKAAEYAYAVASFHLLPAGTFSLMIVAIFAAAFSSLDTNLNRCSALIVRHLLPAYRKFLGLKPLEAEREVRLGRIGTIVSGCIVMGVATLYTSIRDSSIFDVMLRVIAQLMLPQFIPLLLFLFIRKVPRWAVYSSLAGGYLPPLAMWLTGKFTGQVFSYQQIGMAVIVGGTAGFLIARLFWNRVPPAEKAATAAFYREMLTPVDFEKEIGKGTDLFQIVMMGRFSFLMACLFLLLLIPVSSTAGRQVVGSIAGFTGSVGLAMMLYGRHRSRKGKLADSIECLADGKGRGRGSAPGRPSSPKGSTPSEAPGP